jgi:hypothetical protein
VKRLAYERRPGPRRSGLGGEPAADFVSEADVRRAIVEGRKIRLAKGAIVTPSARDLAHSHGILADES